LLFATLGSFADAATNRRKKEKQIKKKQHKFAQDFSEYTKPPT